VSKLIGYQQPFQQQLQQPFPPQPFAQQQQFMQQNPGLDSHQPFIPAPQQQSFIPRPPLENEPFLPISSGENAELELQNNQVFPLICARNFKKVYILSFNFAVLTLRNLF